MRERINLFYYNIFRFERFVQYMVCYPLYGGVKLTSLGGVMEERTGKERWDEHLLDILNDPKGGMSLHFAGIQVTIHIGVLFLTILNLICGFLLLDLHTFWFYGMLVICVLVVIVSNNLAPSDTKQYLGDFKKFELMPKAWKRRTAFLTFLLILGIWAAFISTFIFYLGSLFATKSVNS